jgi:hypothetical protein
MSVPDEPTPPEAEKPAKSWLEANTKAISMLGSACIITGLGFIHRMHDAPSPPAIEQQAPPRQAASAPLQIANGDAVIPQDEIADLYGAPNPATVSAVLQKAREFCNATGTDENPLNADVLAEMASGEIAAFDAVRKRGVALTEADKACYRDANIMAYQNVENTTHIEDASGNTADAQ